MGPLGMPELLIIGLIIVILFGARRIPEVAKGLGEGIRNFKSGMRGGDDAHELDDRRSRDDDRRYRDDDRRYRDDRPEPRPEPREEPRRTV